MLTTCGALVVVMEWLPAGAHPYIFAVLGTLVAVMEWLPAGKHPYIFVGLVASAAIIVRYTVGWWWLIAVWLGSSALLTLPYVIWVYYVSPLSPDETCADVWWVARTFFPMWLTISGMVVWLVATIVPPRTRPEQTPSELSGRPEDTHELLGIPRRYEALLNTHREARQQATGRSWYHKFRLTVIAMIRPYVPGCVQEDWRSLRQFWRAPDDFRRDFVAAAPVLTALHEMPTAHLSAVEAYHRVNLTRVRRRLFLTKIIYGLLAGILSLVVEVSSSVLPSVIPNVASWNTVWNTVQASIRAFVAQPQHWGFISLSVGLVLGLILMSVTGWRMQRRLEALGELLTVALAARREESTAAPSARGPSPGTPGDHSISGRPGPPAHTTDSRDVIPPARPSVKHRQRAVNGRKRRRR